MQRPQQTAATPIQMTATADMTPHLLPVPSAALPDTPVAYTLSPVEQSGQGRRTRTGRDQTNGLGGAGRPTLAPCFTSMKELLQAKVHTVYYCGDFPMYGNDLDIQLREIIRRFKTV